MRTWMTIAIAGGSIAFLGLLQKASGAHMIFWGMSGTTPEDYPFFATYYYHANAGAFLNLALPPAVGLAVRAFGRPDQHISRSLWLTAALLTVVAVLANTSRMAQLLGIIMAFVLVMGPVRQAIRGISKV